MQNLRTWCTFLAACVLLVMFTTEPAQAQNDKVSKKQNKLIQKTWEVKHIVKNGRKIDIGKITGSTIMDFYTYKKKDKKTKKKVTTNKFQMEMGGSDRIFDYKIEQDSVKFVGVNGWNDFKILTIDKENLEMQQLMDGNLISWVLEPAEEQRKHK